MEARRRVSRFALDLDQLQLRVGKLQQGEAPCAIAFVRSRQHRFGLWANLRVQRLRFRSRMQQLLVKLEERCVQLQSASLAVHVDASAIGARRTFLKVRTAACTERDGERGDERLVVELLQTPDSGCNRKIG